MIEHLILILLAMFSGLYSQSNPSQVWQQKLGEPIGIYAGGFVSCDDSLYSIGGSSSRGPLSNTFQYDLSTNEWVKKASMKTAHKNGAYVSVNGKIHVIAGDPFSNVHEVYDPIKNEWSKLAPIPTKVQHVMGVVVHDKIYVMGGLESWTKVSNSNQVYDINTDTWAEMAPMPIGKHGYASIVHDEKIYVFGSLVQDSNGVYGANKTIQVYDIKSDSWKSFGNMPTTLYLGAIVVYGDDVLIIGGFRDGDQPTASVDIFSLKTQTWRPGLALEKAFVGMAALVHKDQLYVSGGADPTNGWVTNQYVYHLPIKTLLDDKP